VQVSWRRMSALMGGIGHPLIALGLLAVAIFPVATKIRQLPVGVPWTTAVDLGVFIGPVLSVLILLLLLALVPPRIHAEQEAEIAQLRDAAKPRLLLRHLSDCSRCDGPSLEYDDMPTFRVEISNTGLSSTRAVHLAIESISSPSAIPWSLTFPVELAAWDALNPGSPAVHADLMHWNIKFNTFVLGRNLRPPINAAACTIALVAHALDTPHTKTQFLVESDGGLWRLRQIDPRGPRGK
jgi:hypothetical protein